MTSNHYTIIETLQENSSYLAQNSKGEKVLLRKYSTLPKDEKLAPYDHSNILAPLVSESAQGEEKAYRTYPIFPENLETYLEKHSLTLAEKISIAIALTEALQFAHEKEVLHGHIEPKTIFLTEKLIPQLCDFALPPPNFGNLDSVSDGLLELPYCLDPEQAAGEPAIQASDYYSLGATFYFLLTGRYPFNHENPLELLHCHMYETPRSIEQWEGPYYFRELIFRMMDKDPKIRPTLKDILTQLKEIPTEEKSTKKAIVEQPNWPLRIVLLTVGILMFLALPQVQLFLREGTLGSLYKTKGQSVKIFLKNGETMTGLLLETQGGGTQDRIHFRKTEGQTYSFSNKEIEKILPLSEHSPDD